MKKYIISILLLISQVITSAQAVEIEGRVGISNTDIWGLHIGAYVRMPMSGLFSIQTGALLHTSEWGGGNLDDCHIALNVPVYASFSLPLRDVSRLRLNVGPYAGVGNDLRLGVSGEAGVELKRYYVGLACFLNCVNERHTQLNLSFGYRF